MPRIVGEARLGDGRLKPVAGGPDRITLRVEEDKGRGRLLPQRMEFRQCHAVQRDVPRLSRLCLPEREDAAVEVDIGPLEGQLLRSAHPGVKGEDEDGQVMGPVFPDHRRQTFLLLRGEEANAIVIFCLAFDL